MVHAARLWDRVRPWHSSMPPRERRTACAVLSAWLLATAAMFSWTAPAFINSCHAHLKPPPGSPSLVAQRLREAHFLAPPLQAEMTLVIESDNGAIGDDRAVRAYQRAVYNRAMAFWREHEQRHSAIWVDGPGLRDYDINGGGVSWMASPDGRVAVMNFYNVPYPAGAASGARGVATRVDERMKGMGVMALPSLEDAAATYWGMHPRPLPPPASAANLNMSKEYTEADLASAARVLLGDRVDVAAALGATPLRPGNASAIVSQLLSQVPSDARESSSSSSPPPPPHSWAARHAWWERLNQFLDYMQPCFDAALIREGPAIDAAGSGSWGSTDDAATCTIPASPITGPFGIDLLTNVSGTDAASADGGGENAAASGGTYRTTLTGGIAFHRANHGKTVQSLKRMELIVLPAAFLVLWYFLEHVQLLIIPFVSVALSAGLAFALCLPVARYSGAISGDCPEIIVSTCVALSIDYSLFLLTRFLEGVREYGEHGHLLALRDTITYTAHTIATSALLVAAAFFSSCFIPIAPLKWAGACLGLTALSTLVTNVTVIPAMLVVFGRWLVPPAAALALPHGCCRCGGGACVRGRDEGHRTWCAALDACEAGVPRVSDASDDEGACSSPCGAAPGCAGGGRPPQVAVAKGEPGYHWYRLAQWVRRHAAVVVCAVVVASLPLLWAAPRVRVSTNRDLSVDRYAGATRGAWVAAEHGIPGGRLHPASIVVEWKADGSLMSDEGFALLHALGDAVEASLAHVASGAPQQDPPPTDRILSPAHPWGTRIDFATARARLTNTSSAHHAYRTLCARTISRAGAWGLVAVFFDFPAYSSTAGDWVKDMRRRLAALEAKGSGTYALYLDANTAAGVDAEQLIVGAFPLVSAVLCAALMVIVGVIFKSVLIPLRLLVALTYTLAITLGAAYYVYQTDAFYWLFPYLPHYHNGGLDFVVPAILLPVCIALGLDYDIFLISRVVEFREKGVPDAQAVVMGVAKTGSTISGAGVIMAIAFGGLLASPAVKMTQFGTLLVVSVLVDTFLIRTVVVPALMVMAAEWNWWPRVMPPAYCSALPLPSDDDDAAASTDTDGMDPRRAGSGRCDTL